MTTIQLVIAGASFIIVIIAAIIAGAWVKQRGWERQIEAFRSEMNSFRNEMKAEIRAEIAKVIGEVGTLRVEQTATREKVDRIERQLDAIFKPVLPGRGDLGDDR
jgi:peptidoglycan hydrolase CwlO-like protein